MSILQLEILKNPEQSLDCIWNHSVCTLFFNNQPTNGLIIAVSVISIEIRESILTSDGRSKVFLNFESIEPFVLTMSRCFEIDYSNTHADIRCQ